MPVKSSTASGPSRRPRACETVKHRRGGLDPQKPSTQDPEPTPKALSPFLEAKGSKYGWPTIALWSPAAKRFLAMRLGANIQVFVCVLVFIYVSR